MNYRYSTTTDDFILTEKEHEAAQLAIKRGQTILMFRGGTLGINMSLLKSWSKTERPTEMQQMLGVGAPRLPSGPLPKADPKKMAETHDRLWDQWGLKHGKKCPRWCGKKGKKTNPT